MGLRRNRAAEAWMARNTARARKGGRKARKTWKKITKPVKPFRYHL